MSEWWLTLVITSLVFGYTGHLYVKRTGRHPARWTVVTVVLNVTILAVMLVSGSRTPSVRGTRCAER